jgi:hypothetical protein
VVCHGGGSENSATLKVFELVPGVGSRGVAFGAWSCGMQVSLSLWERPESVPPTAVATSSFREWLAWRSGSPFVLYLCGWYLW